MEEENQEYSYLIHLTEDLQDGTPMMGNPRNEQEWAEPNPTPSHNHNGDRHFNHWLWCKPPRDTDGGTLVEQGKNNAHQLPGTSGSDLGNKMPGQGQTQHHELF